jgi:hypothetical protein
LAKRLHHGRRQVVLAVDASRIPALDEEEGWGAIDQHGPDVRRHAHATTVFDLEPEARQVGNLVAEPRCLVLAPASLSKPNGLYAVSSIVHQGHSQNLSTPFEFRLSDGRSQDWKTHGLSEEVAARERGACKT